MRHRLNESFKSSVIRDFAEKHGGLSYANCAGDITDDMIAYQEEYEKNEHPNIDKSYGNLVATFRAKDGKLLVLDLNDNARKAGFTMQPTWGGGRYLFKNHDDWSREINHKHGYSGEKDYNYHTRPKWARYGYDSRDFRDDMRYIKNRVTESRYMDDDGTWHTEEDEGDYQYSYRRYTDDFLQKPKVANNTPNRGEYVERFDRAHIFVLSDDKKWWIHATLRAKRDGLNYNGMQWDVQKSNNTSTVMHNKQAIINYIASLRLFTKATEEIKNILAKNDKG